MGLEMSQGIEVLFERISVAAYSNVSRIKLVFRSLLLAFDRVMHLMLSMYATSGSMYTRKWESNSPIKHNAFDLARIRQEYLAYLA